MGSSVLFSATSAAGVRWSAAQLKGSRLFARSSLDTDVSDMSVNGEFFFLVSCYQV